MQAKDGCEGLRKAAPFFCSAALAVQAGAVSRVFHNRGDRPVRDCLKRLCSKCSMEYYRLVDTDNDRAIELLNRIVDLGTAFQAKLSGLGSDLGLSVSQSAVLTDIAGHPQSTLQEVADRLGMPKSTVSRVVDELVGLDMANREIPADNRRVVYLSLPKRQESHCLKGTLDTFFPAAKGKLPPKEYRNSLAALDYLISLMK